MPDDPNQKILKEFLARRHPDYNRLICHWDFVESTYHGGRDWFAAGNIFQYLKEGTQEYNDRLARAYRFNHTREVTDLVQKYIFKSKITRNETDAPHEIKDFWLNTTLSGLDITQFMKLVSTKSSILGFPWIFVDSTKSAEVISVADAKAAKARVYAYVVKPQDVLDMGFTDEGELNWVLVREYVRDDGDPILSSGEFTERYRLWERNQWRLFEIQEIQDKGKKRLIVVQIDKADTNLGEVPGFPVPHVVGDNRYSAPGLIDDIAYLDRACANYLSNLDAIIQDQTFSQLAMPAQAKLPGEDEYEKLLELGTKRVFLYDGEGGAKPEFLSPDPKQAQMIITVINKIINEIYHTIGMAGERTKEDNAVGIDNSSGVAKAYDFERMNSLLTSKADSLENAENKLVRLVLLWHDEVEPKAELVKYPDTFDVRSLFDEFTIAERLALVDAPEAVRREQMKQVIDKLFPRLAEDLKKQMLEELEEWPPSLEDMMVTGTMGAGNSVRPPMKGTKLKSPKPAATNRQGQVTKKTT
jgi:hypothetical protein